MNKFLSVYGKGGVLMLKLLAGFTLLAAIPISLMEDWQLFGGLAVGYTTGGIFCWTLTNRADEGEKFDERKAAEQLQQGTLIRIGSLCLIMGIAAQFSKRFFLVALAGYLFFLVFAFVSYVVFRLQKKR